MLVNAAQMLQSAEKGHYAVAAFNTNNLEWTRSILAAAEELQSPVIVQCTAGAAKWQQGFKTVADVVRDLCDYMKITVPVAMHLDHGSYEDCFKAIEAGFTSIMYDGSHEETSAILAAFGVEAAYDGMKAVFKKLSRSSPVKSSPQFSPVIPSTGRPVSV